MVWNTAEEGRTSVRIFVDIRLSTIAEILITDSHTFSCSRLEQIYMFSVHIHKKMRGRVSSTCYVFDCKKSEERLFPEGARFQSVLSVCIVLLLLQDQQVISFSTYFDLESLEEGVLNRLLIFFVHVKATKIKNPWKENFYKYGVLCRSI
jgi:hypothetical protein